MNTTWDLLISSFIGGILMFAIFSLNASLMFAGYETTRDAIAQGQLLGFTQLIEYDFNKIGYRSRVPSAPTAPRVIKGDSTEIIYKSDDGNNHIVHTIRYIVGTVSEASTTPNPRDFPLYKYIQGAQSLKNYYGLTSFRLNYYDSTGISITMPITAESELNRIKSIKVRAIIQSFFPVDTTYASCYWERTFFPKNIQQ
jgi:hypothetical protein